MGYPLEGIECEIRDELEQKVPHNEVGTLWVKGGNIMMGYYKAPEATEKTLKNGWLNTGDLATLSPKGILAITGRSKDLIIHKGFNIYPAEIENVLMQHPAVFRAAVIGQDDTAAGQVPVAFIATKFNYSSLEANLRNWCANNLASYKIPRKFICMEELPMNNTGKIDKKILRNHL